MKNRLTTCLGILVCLFVLPLSSEAQELLDVRIESFYCDSSDESAKLYPMTDYDGNLYALVKVRPASAAFHFRFGYLKCIVDRRHTGETWLYVRKGARYLTIERKGYESITDVSLGMVLESGATYVLNLSYIEPEPVVFLQPLQFAESSLYANLAFQFLTPRAVGVAIGGYLSNVNMELFFYKGLEFSRYIVWKSDQVIDRYSERYSSMTYGGRFGYGFSFDQCRLTPQAGICVLQVNGTNRYVDCFALNIQVGGRIEYMIVNHLSLVLAPYYRFCISQSECYKLLLSSGLSSKFKDWKDGFDIQLGLSWSF